ncbi:MAG: insulinase family protein, partial [Clostridia bacterium]|nr:insulinase family protein [Clostridia bacterium]
MKRTFMIAILLCLFALAAFAETADGAPAPEIGDVVCGFRLTAIDEIELFQSVMYTYEHEKTGAQLCYLANDDIRRSFSIGFHTPVMSDKGIPHVFEHAALGGSRKYPDPNLVMSMGFGTYSTMLNAYTDSTYTAFETASLSEEQLLMNMDVYLDGVFHPLVVEDEHAMMREAYRYELTDREAPISLQGIVYAEMEGALTQEQMAYAYMSRLMYPGSSVGSLSGGLPSLIPEITYQELCDFHAKYYTPANSLTVLYGSLDIERALRLIDEGYFSHYDRTPADLTDVGYRPLEGDVTGRITFPASAGTEPETVMYYAIPIGELTTAEEYILAVCLSILEWPQHYMNEQMAQEFPNCSWAVSSGSNKEGVSILFYANGIEADRAEQFRAICDEALEQMRVNGFDPADVRVYADSARYVNAFSSEDMDGVLIAEGLFDCWDSRGDVRALLEAYDLMAHLTVLENDNKCDTVFRKALEQAYGHVLVISVSKPGEAERQKAEFDQRLADMKAGMTDEELDALIARTEDYDAWLQAACEHSMLNQVTAITVENLPEEDVRAYASVEEAEGLTTISSVHRHTDLIASNLILDASSVPVEYLLPMRIFCLLAIQLDTESRDRVTLSRDCERVANSLWLRMNTLENKADGSWIPVFEITWNTFTDLAAESVDLIDDILLGTSVEDIEYIRSIIASDVMDRRTNYTDAMPYSIAVQEAGRQKDPQMAYKLLYGGYNLIEYEERLAGMDDASLRSELQKAKEALSYVLHSDHAILTVSGERDSIRMMQSLVRERLSKFEPMGEPIAYADVLANETGNTAFTIDTNVSYNLEYMSMDQLGINYTGALSAFINLAEDQ